MTRPHCARIGRRAFLTGAGLGIATSGALVRAARAQSPRRGGTLVVAGT